VQDTTPTWAAAAAGLLGALFAVDVLTGDSTVLAPLYVLGPLVAALGSRPRTTAVIGALAVVLALVSVLLQVETGVQDAVRVATVALGSGLAVAVAVLRERLERANADARATEQRLAEAFGLLDVIFERAPVGLAFFDRDLRYVRVNERMAEINGMPVAAHIGRTVADVIPDLAGEVPHDLRSVLATGEPIVEVELAGETPAQPGVRREWSVSYWPVRRAEEVAGIGAVVIEVTERRAAERELRTQTARYETLLLALSEVGEGMVVVEGERFVYANPAFEQLSGYALPELLAMESLYDLVAPAHREEARRRATVRIEDDLVDPTYQLTMRRRDGAEVELELAGVPLRVEGRQQLVVVVRDVTARRRAEAERERLLQRSALLAEASELFDQTLDQERTIESIARLSVRELADTCLIALGDPALHFHRVAVAGRDPERERLMAELQARFPLHNLTGLPAQQSLRMGRGVVIDHPHGAWREPLAENAEHLALLRQLDVNASIVVPLRARGRVHGILALNFERLDEADRRDLLALFEDLGRRAALALDTARLYEERSKVARTLQRSLLPPELPAIPGMELAARYLAAGEGIEVGGDFYDCFRTGRGDWALVIGDVCGKGAEAAAVTALARHTLRASVMHTPRPADVLRELNEALLRGGLDYRFCTVLYASLRRRGDRVAATLATGGHPLPLVLRASGLVEAAGATGTLLGIVPDPDISEETIELEAGDALVLYTDGVIEASPVDDAFGPARLSTFVRGCIGRDAPRIAEAIERQAVAVQGGRLRDDVAVVVVRVSPEGAASFAAAGEGVAAPSRSRDSEPRSPLAPFTAEPGV
jgi:PAS domain S-box-containing protein